MSTAAPRFTGKLVKWNPDRGFGFVVADQGGQKLFVHVSAFPRDGQPPVIGKSLSFSSVWLPTRSATTCATP